MILDQSLLKLLIQLLASRLLTELDFRVLEVKDRALLVEHRESKRQFMLGLQEIPS